MQEHNHNDHVHCWHALRGPIWMVIPDGHTVQKCCECSATRTIHVDHALGRDAWSGDKYRCSVNPMPSAGKWGHV